MASNQGEKRLVKSKSGLKIVALSSKGHSPFELPEPRWVPDNSVAACEKCNSKFDFMTRRHHCRRCGLCFCGKCCKDKTPLPRMCFVDPVLQCRDCSACSKKENEFFDKHLKVLLAGASFEVGGEAESSGAGEVVQAAGDEPVVIKLLQDHKSLVLEGQESDPIDLTKVDGIRIIKAGPDPHVGGTGSLPGGVAMRYKDSHGEVRDLQLTVPLAKEFRKPSQLWVVAMQKAAKILYVEPTTP